MAAEWSGIQSQIDVAICPVRRIRCDKIDQAVNIQYLCSMDSKSNKENEFSADPEIFISHSSTDNVVVNELVNLLAAAGKAAYSEAKVVGLPKIFATEQEIILETSDGKQKVISTASREGKDAFFKKFLAK